MNHRDSPAAPPPPRTQKSSRATIAGALVLAAVLAGGLFALMDRTNPPEPQGLVEEVATGEALYRSHCMECHGEKALGDGPLAASLPVKPPVLFEHLAHHTRAQLIQLIRSGIPPAMPAPPLDDGQIQLVIDYVWTLVPADQVDALREMQSHVEMGHMPSMPMPGMQHADSGSMDMNH